MAVAIIANGLRNLPAAKPLKLNVRFSKLTLPADAVGRRGDWLVGGASAGLEATRRVWRKDWGIAADAIERWRLR